MLDKLWKKCVNYETVSYLLCGILTTVVDFAVYTVLRADGQGLGVGLSQAFSWVAAVLFAYVGNKLVVFRNYNFRPAHLLHEAAGFVTARIVSGVVVWLMMVLLVRLGNGDGMLFEWACKVLSSAVNLILNYLFSKLWVFRRPGGKGKQDGA